MIIATIKKHRCGNINCEMVHWNGIQISFNVHWQEYEKKNTISHAPNLLYPLGILIRLSLFIIIQDTSTFSSTRFNIFFVDYFFLSNLHLFFSVYLLMCFNSYSNQFHGVIDTTSPFYHQNFRFKLTPMSFS